MVLFESQRPLVSAPSQSLSLLKASISCHGVWDSKEARFKGCFLPIISLLPGIVAITVLLCRILWPLIRNRVSWLRPFVVEYHNGLELPKWKTKNRFTASSIAVLCISIAGFFIDAAVLLQPRPDFTTFLPAISWATVVLLTIVDKPKSAPVSCLIIIVSVLVTHLALQLNNASRLLLRDLPSVLAIFAAFGALAVILCMPLRHPGLPVDQISAPFEPPTRELRSPEDRLTPWQFMTVSWMRPLILNGYKKQLNDEDVWNLGYEFQHRGLHERFRELKGSVVRRLLASNGIDLAILTLLALLDSAGRFSIPVLLQLLLRSMEDITAPRRAAIVYAFISLTVRLIRAQCQVFALWYGRRCYERSRGEMITMLHEKVLSRKIVGASLETKDPNPPDKQPASMGKILNLMRNDVYEVSQRFWDFQELIQMPLSFILSVVLIWKLVGWPCLFGVVTVLIAQIINVFITKLLLKWERIRRSASDSRLQKTSQFVEAIRHLRWYGWQEFWLTQILEARQKELKIRVRTRILDIMITFCNILASNIFPVAAFYAYTTWAGLPLRIDIAFPALQLFNMLESSLRNIPRLIKVLLNAKIAVDRIEDFMAEPDKYDDNSTPPEESDKTCHSIEKGSFSWPGREHSVLHDVTLDFPSGLTVIIGEVASGKTALLQAILGEMDTRSGRVIQPKGMVGYCAQSPWIQSMSIRDNILFSSPLEEERYNKVLNACALTVDINSFKDRDLSLIGENGIGLSGGQRARIALARAVYSRARTLLLDDPLSALDHQTADSIVKNCVRGPLMDGRTIILVTHRTELCQDFAQQMIEVVEGRAHVLDHATNLPALLQMRSHESADGAKRGKKGQEEITIPEKFIEDEKREHGGVKLRVYWEYIKAGKLKWWFVLILVMVISRLMSIGENWFLKAWGEAYDRPEENIASGGLDSLPSPETNVKPWLLGFFIIAVSRSISSLLSQIIMTVILYTSGLQMFRDIMQRVGHAAFRFYDVTPVGRLMNRMTSDIGVIDGGISSQLQNTAFLTITWGASLVVIASATPIFLIFSFALTAAFVYIFQRFLPTSQSLRRLEMVSLSPLMSNFGALLHGLTTVRAFCAQSRFQDRVIEVTDAFQKMDHFYWSLQAWLSYRYDILSCSSTFVLTLIALYTGVSPGLTAFVLIAAGQFIGSTHSLCKVYGQIQMDFVSVERVVELLHVEQEPTGTIDLPASWPSYGGDVIFENVTIKYAPQLEPSLSDLSFCIPGGSTTALLGRTGSGKSTLALSLLATILPTTGSIFIDGKDIAEVDTQILRHRITFLAQDPVLFPGTMRQNLDPLDEHTDEECDAVLQRVCKKHNWKLDTQIDTGGSNLSQGQRQLVGLTRAVLRRSSIIILDEATASIDRETAMTIQQILREEMRESTVITIAHRLEAVKDADFYIRLDHGKVVEHGPVNARTVDAMNGKMTE